MINMNRLANCHNRYQGKYKRVLCICSAGMLRSPTIAWVLSNPPYNCNTRAAGLMDEYALIPVDQVLLEWADEFVCAESSQAQSISILVNKGNKMMDIEPVGNKPVHCLNIPDSFEMRDPRLIKEIKKALKICGFGFKGTE